MVHNLIERPPIRLADRLERAVSRIPDTEQISHLGAPGGVTGPRPLIQRGAGSPLGMPIGHQSIWQ